MIEKAIEKIKAEMEANKDNEAVQVIGDFLLKQIEINKDAAAGILQEGKTILKSLEEMQKEALAKVKKKTGTQCVAIAPAEGFKIIMKYFSFEAVQDKILEVEVNEIKETNDIKSEEVNKKDVSFDVNLDDILGGL
ncbi:hypothetical protein [Clostridium sp. C2-6-12]|uniref:hypothetical protein n=1 Tax=Clostridium sp. C2-6-12 TaxID=2698832 RepID=UPI00136E7709|nr:hypothetical protein [Clostridium sp. C2-6-12]